MTGSLAIGISIKCNRLGRTVTIWMYAALSLAPDTRVEIGANWEIAEGFAHTPPARSHSFCQNPCAPSTGISQYTITSVGFLVIMLVLPVVNRLMQTSTPHLVLGICKSNQTFFAS